MINNRVNGGYLCHQCGGVFQSMWGITCNDCSKKNSDNEKLVNEIKLLRKQLAEKVIK